MSIAKINDVDIYFETAGDGDTLVLTHGSWTDANGWNEAVAQLSGRYRVVTWDRRGHSRSRDGDGPGSRHQDARDLAALVEHVSDDPVHVVGSSYGANVTLTVLTMRPDLVLTAAVHEPPLFGLLEGSADEAVRAELAAAEAELGEVAALIRDGAHRQAAERFVEHVALGPGAWAQLPEPFRATLAANAPTYLDELNDETGLSIDAAALASLATPVLLTNGTESPALFSDVLSQLTTLMSNARVEVLDGAGHIPYKTHTELWATTLVDFHLAGRRVASSTRGPS